LLLYFRAHLPFLRQAPGHQQEVDTRMNKAQGYLREKRPDLAIPEFKAIIALDPDNVNARANLGVLLFFQGDYANAAPHCEQR